MKNAMKKAAQSLLGALDLEISRRSTLLKLLDEKTTEARRHRDSKEDIERLLAFPKEQAAQLLTYLPKSKAQLRQDLFVLSQLGFKRDGFFVEFGATNGVDLSNTWLLEKEFGWKGILAEPARCWHADLKRNRTAEIEDRCVWRDSTSTLKFTEAPDAEFSTIESFRDADIRSEMRKGGSTYPVDTISLNDLLSKYDAPRQVDFLSIDTEGTEFEILRHLDFDRYAFRIITVEHNFGPIRDQIFDLLTRHGYVRKYEQLSKFDDWYVR